MKKCWLPAEYFVKKALTIGTASRKAKRQRCFARHLEHGGETAKKPTIAYIDSHLAEK